MPDHQSAVWFPFEANGRVCGKPAGTGRLGLQHLVSTTEDAVGCQSIQGSAGPLHLLIDSAGIKAEGEGEWNARKHGGPKRRLWRKIHIGIDEQSLEIRAIKVTSSSIGDAPMLPALLAQILPDQEIGSVTVDGAYDTRKCHDAIADRNDCPVIPPRKNVRLWTPDTRGAEVETRRSELQSIWAAHCGGN